MVMAKVLEHWPPRLGCQQDQVSLAFYDPISGAIAESFSRLAKVRLSLWLFTASVSDHIW